MSKNDVLIIRVKDARLSTKSMMNIRQQVLYQMANGGVVVLPDFCTLEYNGESFKDVIVVCDKEVSDGSN